MQAPPHFTDAGKGGNRVQNPQSMIKQMPQRTEKGTWRKASLRDLPSGTERKWDR